MAEPRYVRIYCDTERRRQWAQLDSSRRHQKRVRGLLGLCYALKVDGRWQCACCGRKVSVTW